MNTRKLLMASFLTLAAGAAMQVMQTASARELPESVRAFVAEQQTLIQLQGDAARKALMRQVRKDYEVSRLAFIESQERAMRSQGSIAIAAIKMDLDLIRLDGVLARLMPRPDRRWHPEPPLVIIERSYNREEVNCENPVYLKCRRAYRRHFFDAGYGRGASRRQV